MFLNWTVARISRIQSVVSRSRSLLATFSKDLLALGMLCVLHFRGSFCAVLILAPARPFCTTWESFDCPKIRYYVLHTRLMAQDSIRNVEFF